jgi:hypothetical protein
MVMFERLVRQLQQPQLLIEAIRQIVRVTHV